MNFKKNSTGSGLSYAIIGLGRFGTALAIELANRGREILVIDADEERVRCLRDYGLRPGSAERPVEVTVCGAVINLTEKISKNDGHKFYIITIDDSTSQLELSLFSRAAEEFSAILAQRKAEEGRLSLQITDADHYAPAPLIIVVRGWLSQQDGSPQPRLRVRCDRCECRRAAGSLRW